MINLKDILWTDAKPSARITSVIICILTLSLIAFNVITDQWKMYAFAFVGFHLINHLYLTFNEFKINTCSKCGKALEYETKVKKHVCKKK